MTVKPGTSPSGQVRLLVAEPTYRDSEHAAVNAGYLRGLAQAADVLVFASARGQRAAIQDADPGAATLVPWQEIEVMEPGGIRLARMRAQWRILSGLIHAYRPDAAVLLSAGPETLFVARGLATLHRRLRLFVVMHGNLSTAVGWRSKDPRHRLMDMRSALRVARHPNIHLVVLEPQIREVALQHGLARDFLVWPITVLDHEAPAVVEPWQPFGRLRIAWIGAANRRKGFEDYLELNRALGERFVWPVVGIPRESFDPDDLARLDLPAAPLNRPAFLARIRAVDYAFLAFRREYDLTASASLLDCINQRKPILAVRNKTLDLLARHYGPIGHLCDDLAGVRALLENDAMLRDAVAYAGFQRALDAIARSRLPGELATTLKRHLA